MALEFIINGSIKISSYTYDTGCFCVVMHTVDLCFKLRYIWHQKWLPVRIAGCYRCYEMRSCSARAKRTLFLTKSVRTLTHFIMRTHFTFF